MRKLQIKLWLLTLLIFVGGVDYALAQTDVTHLLVNPSFEYSAEGVPYTEETKLFSEGSIYGWTLPSLGSDLYDIQVTPKSSASTGDNTFGQALPSDGDYYFYNRKGWSTVSTSLTQTVNISAGKYYITVDYKAAEWKGYRTKLGFKVADQELINTYCAARFEATTTYFADVEWKTLGAWFTVETEGDVKIEIIETLGGNDRRADICLDNVKLYKWDLDDQINYDNATKLKPMDVTAMFVTNAYFDDNSNGWTSTTGYQNIGRATNKADAFSGGFWENWNGSAKTSGKMYQTLSGLPDGIFRVTAAAFVNNENANVSLYAGTQKTAVNNTTPSWYSVQTTVNGGSLEIGLVLGDGNAANWIGLDNVKLEYLGFDVDAAIAAANEQATAAETHLTDKAYTGYITDLQNAIRAIQDLDGETATKASIHAATNNLVTALNNVETSVSDYANLNTNIAYAKAYTLVNSAKVDDYNAAISAAEKIYSEASEESTAATIFSLQNYKTLDYTYITDTYTENLALGTWTENFKEDLDGEGYVSGGPKYWNEWGSATRTANQTVTLPAGDYAISAIGRGAIGTSGYLYYKIGDADPVSVDFLMKGNRGRGVDINGAANFAEGGDYNCDGAGFGWEYRFLTFTLEEETSVELGVSATFTGNWVSIYAPQLRTTEATVKSVTLSFINDELTNNIPEGKMNQDVLSALNEKKTAAENASVEDNTKEELNIILEELRTAIAAAEVSVNAYAKAQQAVDDANALKDAHNFASETAATTFAEAIAEIAGKYDAGELSDDEANNAGLTLGVSVSKWHANANAPAVVYLNDGFSLTEDVWGDLYVNTWSTEGENDGSGFKVPFYEYWTNDKESLASRILTGTLTGMENGLYTVKALVRVRVKDGVDVSEATGVTMNVTTGEAVDLTEGERIGESQFLVKEYTAEGLVKDGNLTVNFTVADDNNISWLSFKNVFYKKERDLTEEEAVVNPTAIILDKTAEELYIGRTLTLTPTFEPANATQNATWISSDETVATVNNNGVVTGVKYGIAIITMTSTIDPSVSAQCEVTVTAPLITEAENLDFAEGPVIETKICTYDYDVKETQVAQMQPVTGWTFGIANGNAKASGVMAYGSEYGIGADNIYAPAMNPDGEIIGNALGMVGVWTGSVQYVQNVKLPAGAYKITVPIYRNGGSTALVKNRIGVILDDGTEYLVTRKTYDADKWTTETIEFIVDKDTYGKLSLGLDAPNSGAANSQRLWIDGMTITYDKFATDDDYAALNAAIAAGEEKTLGFDKGEYAPYTNVAALQVLAAAKAINQEVNNGQSKVHEAIAALEAAVWTMNTEDMDAIYNGMFATVAEGANYPDGWTRTNGWGAMQSNIGGDYPTAYYNQPGSLQYGNQGVYTMPLKANTIYQLTVTYRSHENGSNKSMTVSVLNGEEGLTATKFEGNGSTSNWIVKTKLFRTGEAGNYVLTLANEGNTWMTNVSLVKAVIEDIEIAENVDYTPAEKFANVTFNRTLVEGWNGLVLPFDMTVEDVKTTFAAGKVKDFTGISYEEATGVTLKFADFAEETTVIPAGRPFMVKAIAGTSYEIDDVILPATGLKNIEQTAEGYDNIKYVMKGTYAAETDLTDVNFALINGNNFFYHYAGRNASSAKAFRAYFENASENPAAARVSFAFDDEEGTTTAITEVNQPTKAEGTYYDLQGRKVDGMKQKGIYILNGRKVVK